MSSFNAPETLSTLRFGSRAKKIQNKPTVNSETSAKKLMKLLSEAEEKIKRQTDVIHHLHKRIIGVLQESQYTGFRNEFQELVKRVDVDDAAGIYNLLQSGYVDELKEAEKKVEFEVTETRDPKVEGDILYLKKKINESTNKLLKLHIELTEAKNQLALLHDEKQELFEELKLKTKEVSELQENLKLVEEKAKKQTEEHIRSLTQFELGIENISFLYLQRSREIDQVCKSLDRLLFDENLLIAQYPQSNSEEDLDPVKKLVKDQPKTMFRISINSTIIILQQILAAISGDQSSISCFNFLFSSFC